MLTRTSRMIVLSLTLALTSVGCAALISALPTVIAAVTDAAQILDAIEHFVHAYYLQKPDPVKEAICDKAIAKSRTALNAALRIAQGTEKLDQAKVDEAFADFKLAYQELLVIVEPLGVHAAPLGKFMSTPNGLIVPEPIALHLKVK